MAASRTVVEGAELVVELAVLFVAPWFVACTIISNYLTCIVILKKKKLLQPFNK